MSPHVLVVDDDADLREVVALGLELEGYRVSQARDGLWALAMLEREPANLVLLDLKMPVMDGPSFLAAYRARGGRSPVVVVTASENARLRAHEVGADGFVGKPFDLDALLDVVRAHAGPPAAGDAHAQ